VLLAQLPVPEVGARELTGLNPLGAAALALHARHVGADAGAELVVLPGPDLRRFGDARLLSALLAAEPDVVAFTLAVWNVERSLALVERLRQARPGVEVWLGGPEVARDSRLLARPEAGFQVAVAGEGELAFAALLGGARPTDLPGAVPLGPGVLVPERALGLLPGLGTLHDPYLAALVTPEADGVMLAETWRGCRHHCTFCRYHAGRGGKGVARPLPQVRELVEWALGHGVHELYLLDPSLEQRPDLEVLLDTLAAANPAGLPLFAELRAEAVDQRLATRFKAAGLRGAEIGLQTTNPRALKLAGREFEPEAFVRGLRALHAEGVRTQLDLMLGLPGDGPQGLERSLEFLVRHGLTDGVQVFRTKVLPGTALRRTARRLGVEYDPRPPYGVRATPDWPREALDDALDRVDQALGRSPNALDAPVVCRPAWEGAASCSLPWPDADAVFQYSFRLDTPEGRRALQRQRFQDAGQAAALWLEADDLFPWRQACVTAVQRFLTANPFASLTVVWAGLPEGPLDALAELDAALERDRPSLYLERLHELPRPERRLAAVLEAPWRERIDPGWLEALRQLAGVLWMTRPADLDEASAALRAVEELSGLDALLVAPRHLPEDAAALERDLARLLATCPCPERVTWSPLPVQWAWARLRERD
jgi:hypothetical protein